VTIDGRNEGLPTGEYVAEVTFYPRWGAKKGPSEAKRIDEEISGQADVSLTGSGASKTQTDEQNIAQKWVMLNVNIGVLWNENHVRRETRAVLEDGFRIEPPRCLLF